MNLYQYVSDRLSALEMENKTSTSNDRLHEVKGALAELGMLMTFVNSQEDLIKLEAKGEPAWLNQALNEGDGSYKP